MSAGIIFQNNGSLLLWYLIIVPLLLSFAPYKIARIEKGKRLYFIIFGSIMPLVILYSVIFFALREAIKSFRIM